MQRLGRQYPHVGYGPRFKQWLTSERSQPYYSYGNGAAMRVSPCAYVGKTLSEVQDLAKVVTAVSHNHPEGLLGAQAEVTAIFLARQGEEKSKIRQVLTSHYYALDFTLEEIRSTYRFDASCQGALPQAIMAFLQANSFEETIRNAVFIGGDSDTIAAMAGEISGAYYGIPKEMSIAVQAYLPKPLQTLLEEFEQTFMIEK